MGLFDFFKKIGKSKEFENLKTEKEEIFLDNLQEWIDKKEKEIRKNEQEIIGSVREKILVSEKEINNKLEKLLSTEIASEKPEGRVETIVKENLENYIHYVRNLLKELLEIQKKEYENIGELIKEINNVFSYFEKKSYVNYQKASHLVKKELFETNKSVMNLSKEFRTVFQKNKKTIDSSDSIQEIKLRLNDINQNNESISKFKKEINDIDKRIKHLEEKKNKFSNEIKKIKESDEYKENLEKIEKSELLKRELEKRVLGLKSLIEFKKLAHVFHNDKKKLDLVKSFRENFYSEFFSQRENFIKLISDSGMKTPELDKKISEIKEKESELEEIIKNIDKDKVEQIKKDIRKLEEETEKLYNEKNKKQKSLEKLEERVVEITEGLKEKLEILDAELIEKVS